MARITLESYKIRSVDSWLLTM